MMWVSTVCTTSKPMSCKSSKVLLQDLGSSGILCRKVAVLARDLHCVCWARMQSACSSVAWHVLHLRFLMFPGM